MSGTPLRRFTVRKVELAATARDGCVNREAGVDARLEDKELIGPSSEALQRYAVKQLNKGSSSGTPSSSTSYASGSSSNSSSSSSTVSSGRQVASTPEHRTTPSFDFEANNVKRKGGKKLGWKRWWRGLSGSQNETMNTTVDQSFELEFDVVHEGQGESETCDVSEDVLLSARDIGTVGAALVKSDESLDGSSYSTSFEFEAHRSNRTLSLELENTSPSFVIPTNLTEPNGSLAFVNGIPVDGLGANDVAELIALLATGRDHVVLSVTVPPTALRKSLGKSPKRALLPARTSQDADLENRRQASRLFHLCILFLEEHADGQTDFFLEGINEKSASSGDLVVERAFQQVEMALRHACGTGAIGALDQVLAGNNPAHHKLAGQLLCSAFACAQHKQGRRWAIDSNVHEWFLESKETHWQSGSDENSRQNDAALGMIRAATKQLLNDANDQELWLSLFAFICRLRPNETAIHLCCALAPLLMDASDPALLITLADCACRDVSLQDLSGKSRPNERTALHMRATYVLVDKMCELIELPGLFASVLCEHELWQLFCSVPPDPWTIQIADMTSTENNRYQVPAGEIVCAAEQMLEAFLDDEGSMDVQDLLLQENVQADQVAKQAFQVLIDKYIPALSPSTSARPCFEFLLLSFALRLLLLEQKDDSEALSSALVPNFLLTDLLQLVHNIRSGGDPTLNSFAIKQLLRTTSAMPARKQALLALCKLLKDLSSRLVTEHHSDACQSSAIVAKLARQFAKSILGPMPEANAAYFAANYSSEYNVCYFWLAKMLIEHNSYLLCEDRHADQPQSLTHGTTANDAKDRDSRKLLITTDKINTDNAFRALHLQFTP